MTVRTATAADLPALQQIFRTAALSNAGDRQALLARPQWLEFGGEHLATGRTRLVERDGRPVGFATLVPADAGELELEDLLVHPDWMRRGIARLLVLDAVAIARERGAGRIVVTGNPHALAFYLAVGFVRVGEAPTQLYPAPRLHLAVDPDR